MPIFPSHEEIHKVSLPLKGVIMPGPGSIRKETPKKAPKK